MASKIAILLAAIACFGVTSAFDKASVLPTEIPDQQLQLNFSKNECYDMVRLATAGDRLDMVRLLVDQGCSVNRPRGRSGEPTPLHIAVMNDSVEMVTLLLDYNADVNARAHMPEEINAKKQAMCKYLFKDGRA